MSSARFRKTTLLIDEVSGILRNLKGLDTNKPSAAVDHARENFFRAEWGLGWYAKQHEMSDSWKSSARNSAAAAMAKALPLCESPIEREILPWLIFADYGPELNVMPAATFNIRLEHILPDERVVICPQVPLVRARLDFAIVVNHPVKGIRSFAVECDGIQYHQDHTADVVRDELISQFGIETIRATGRAIRRTPSGVADEIAARIREWARVPEGK